MLFGDLSNRRTDSIQPTNHGPFPRFVSEAGCFEEFRICGVSFILPGYSFLSFVLKVPLGDSCFAFSTR
jgi:hypothetical protein